MYASYISGNTQQMNVTSILSAILEKKDGEKWHLHAKIPCTKFGYGRPDGHCIRSLMHPIDFFVTIALAGHFPQISSQKNCISQPIPSASQFHQISLQQLNQPEYLCIHRREHTANGRTAVLSAILWKKLTKSCTSTQRYCVPNLVTKDMTV